MKEIKLLEMKFENFKKLKDVSVVLGDNKTFIYGENYAGKSSIADGFSWVLYNKSHTGKTEGKEFVPRPWDENGNRIDHVEVKVTVKLSVDGEVTEVTRIQKQDWVRHHGEEVETYEGDKNEYFWDNVPTTPTAHKKKVNELLPEDLFILLTNPAAFPAKKWQDQREFLVKYIAKTSDDELMDNQEFDELKNMKGKLSIPELKKKNANEKSGYEKKQKEIPVRIDQESKHIADVDFTEKEKELEILNATMADIEAKMESTGKAYEEVSRLEKEKADAKVKLIQIEGEHRKKTEEKWQELQKAYDNAESEFNGYFNESRTLTQEIETLNAALKSYESEVNELKSKYTAEIKKEIDANEFVCPTCGQLIPEEQREEHISNFEKKKAENIEKINRDGKRFRELVDNTKSQIKQKTARVEELKELKTQAHGKQNRAKEALDNFSPAVLEECEEWEATNTLISDLEKEIAAIDTSDADELREQLKSQKADTMDKIRAVQVDLAKKDEINKAKETIESLEKELTDVTQSIASCERVESMIRKFEEYRANTISDAVNGKFRIVTWKLFSEQKNGGIEDTCVCMVNGSVYGENTTSTTERMMAGMDIIRTLQEINDVTVPIFLDDADLYNVENIPDMDCQVVNLMVSKDKELRIEVE